MESKNSSHLGFTLIEVLITITILSMLMLSGAAVFNYFSQNWERNRGAYNDAISEFEDVTLVSEVLGNIVPKLVHNDDDLTSFYFLGRENGFTAVTQSSIQNPDYPAVFRLFREFGNGTGWQLVYEEAVLDSVILRKGDQELPFNFRRVVAKGLERLEFEYFGWADLRTRAAVLNETGSGAEPEWFNEFDGMPRRQHPLVIQLIIDDFLWPVTVIDISDELMRRSFEEDI